jgi:hypothetical protein
MGTGEVMPHEVQAQVLVDTSNQDPPSTTRVEPPSSQANQEESRVHGDDHERGFDQGGEQGGEAQEEAPQVEDDDDDGPIQRQSQAHTQEYIKWFNEIIPVKTFLAASKEE